MKYRLLSAVLLAACLSAVKANAAALTLFNTGVDAGGGVLVTGSADPHWTASIGSLTSGGPQASVLLNQRAGIYVQGSASSWIFINPEASGTGLYTFGMEFDLSSFDPASASITGSFAVDNEATIYLNGQNVGIGTGALSQTGYTSSAFTGWHNFTLNNGFQSGINRLDFVVNNIDSVGGLNVTLSGEATAVPEPSSVALGGGLLGLLLRRRRGK